MKLLTLSAILVLITATIHAATEVVVAENTHTVVKVNEPNLIKEAQRFIDPSHEIYKITACSRIIVFRNIQPADCIAAEMTEEFCDKDNKLHQDHIWFWFGVDGKIIKDAEFRILDDTIIPCGPIIQQAILPEKTKKREP